MIALVALAAIATAPIYSDVWMHPETGDVLGMELRIHSGARPTIDFALCEGECSGASDIPVVRRRGGFDFVYHGKLVDQDGKPVPDWVVRFSARFWRGRLVIQQIGGDREVLKRRSKPWGLALLPGPMPSVP